MEIQQTETRQNVRATMQMMEPGDICTFEGDRVTTARNYATLMKAYSGKIFEVNKIPGGVTVTRII